MREEAGGDIGGLANETGEARVAVAGFRLFIIIIKVCPVLRGCLHFKWYGELPSRRMLITAG